jgi:hypothetical protein
MQYHVYRCFHDPTLYVHVKGSKHPEHTWYYTHVFHDSTFYVLGRYGAAARRARAVTGRADPIDGTDILTDLIMSFTNLVGIKKKIRSWILLNPKLKGKPGNQSLKNITEITGLLDLNKTYQTMDLLNPKYNTNFLWAERP